jgi:CheY-like chemotaxis protein
MNLYKARKLINISEARILAVDDVRALCAMVATWLLREKISSDKAYCVDDAISLMRHTHYDLVISDITMPGKSTIEFLSIVRSNNRSHISCMDGCTTICLRKLGV